MGCVISVVWRIGCILDRPSLGFQCSNTNTANRQTPLLSDDIFSPSAQNLNTDHHKLLINETTCSKVSCLLAKTEPPDRLVLKAATRVTAHPVASVTSAMQEFVTLEFFTWILQIYLTENWSTDYN